ncbi:MAG: phosphatase PAP2 family protein [Candidatus Zixiibacteriota bacterium]|nr:MAG: phosphatase PAP2 family protein [candidate division Zixibacteria bacterium]
MNMPENRRRIALYPSDYIVIGYCTFMALACALLGRPISTYYDEIVIYLSLAAISALIIRFMNEHGPGWQRFLRLLYPVLLVGPLYSLTGGTMFLIFDHFLDANIVALEKAVFGVNPTIYIDRHLLNVWLNELLSACYFSYYFYLPGFFLSAFFLRKYDIIKRALTGVMLMYVVSFLIFWLYPVEGPRWVFADRYLHPVNGLMFRHMVEFVIAHGAVRGGAMPSSHTGIALIVLIYLFVYFRRAAWPIMPIVLGLAIGTVWGRFHYVSDVVVGSLIAILSFWAERKFYDRWTGNGGTSIKKHEMETADVT